MFPGDDGEAPFVASHYHPVSEQLTGFAAAGLEVVRCAEPIVDPALPSMVPPPLLEAARAAFGGAPFALLWELRRSRLTRGSPTPTGRARSTVGRDALRASPRRVAPSARRLATPRSAPAAQDDADAGQLVGRRVSDVLTSPMSAW